MGVLRRHRCHAYLVSTFSRRVSLWVLWRARKQGFTHFSGLSVKVSRLALLSFLYIHALRGREDGKQTTNLNFATGNLGKKTEEPFEL